MRSLRYIPHRKRREHKKIGSICVIAPTPAGVGAAHLFAWFAGRQYLIDPRTHLVFTLESPYPVCAGWYPPGSTALMSRRATADAACFETLRERVGDDKYLDRVFSRADHSKDGTLDRAELRVLLADLGRVSGSDIDFMLCLVDGDGTGTVTKSELRVAVQVCCSRLRYCEAMYHLHARVMHLRRPRGDNKHEVTVPSDCSGWAR